jgi:hypothetical protein
MIRVLRETHETPEWVEGLITRAGGRNRFSWPNFRVVWGWNRLGWIPKAQHRGTQSSTESHGTTEYEWGPVYGPPLQNPNRWYLERWVPPEMYGVPAAWLEKELGPYPSMGDYEHVLTLEEPKTKSFVQLSAGSLELMIQVVEFCRGFRMAERKAALRAREERKEKQFENDAADILDDAKPAMYGCPFVTVPK